MVKVSAMGINKTFKRRLRAASTKADALTTGTSLPSRLSLRSLAAFLTGYDIFISFALGPPPRGTLSYASDLARRLRENDIAVFFSEEEGLAGQPLTASLRKGLHRSKILVVIANRATLADPRWVRRETEEFLSRHPDRPVIAINVDGALQDPELAPSTAEWLDHQRVWEAESADAVERGIAGAAVVSQLLRAVPAARANRAWRWVVGGTMMLLTALTAGFGWEAHQANERELEARQNLLQAIAMRVLAEGQAVVAGVKSGETLQGVLQVLAAHRIQPGKDSYFGLQSAVLRHDRLLRLLEAHAPLGNP